MAVWVKGAWGIGIMDNYIAEDLMNSLMKKGKSADVVTHTIKTLSDDENGTMPDGLIRIIDAFEIDKEIAVANTKRNFGVGGLVTGVVAAGLAVGGLWYRSNKKKQIAHEKECEEIIATLRKEAAKENTKHEELSCKQLGTTECE